MANADQQTDHPVTRSEAEQILFYDHVRWYAAERDRLAGHTNTDPAYHLEVIARAAEIVHQLDGWQAITIHRAVLAGATLSDLAEAFGEPPSDVVDRWQRWSAERRQWWEGGFVPPSDNPAKHDRVAATLAEQLGTPTT